MEITIIVYRAYIKLTWNFNQTLTSLILKPDKNKYGIKEEDMRRRLVVLFLVLSLMVTVMAGCGSGKSADNAPMAPPLGGSSNEKAYGEQGMADSEPPYDADYSTTADSLAGGGSAPIDVTNVILAERKIIRSANLTIEVEHFDNAFANIEGIIANIGFIQQTNINTDRVYVEEDVKLVKNGVIVLRVDKTMFDSVINKLRGLGDVYNYTTDGQDVTDQVFDVESRLRLLKMEQEKLEAYVFKLDNLEEIFKAESKLTEIRYQIESLTGNLNKLNSLVDLSTITINLNEKRPDRVAKPETYGDKLLNTIKESLLGAVEFLGELLLFIIAALPALILIGICALIGLRIYKKTIKKRSSSNTNVREPEYHEAPVIRTSQTPPAQGGGPSRGSAQGQGSAPVQEIAQEENDKPSGN
jgi:hypothetical protein